MTEAQIEDGWQVGLARADKNRAAGHVHRHDWTPEEREQRRTDAMSAVAEYFVALKTGREWLGRVKQSPLGDVEGLLEVRHTVYSTGCLIVHKSDLDDWIGVLVVGGRMKHLRIPGYLPIRECKREEWWRPKGPKVRCAAYYVKQKYLVDTWRDLCLPDATPRNSLQNLTT